MRAEYILSRAARLREEMRASGASAYVALNDEDSNWESLFYLSGFRGTAGAIIIYDNAEPELILDGRYAEAGRAQSPYKVTEQEESLAEDVRASLRAHGAEEILCEARKTSHENWLRLADGLGRWRDGGAVMEKLRRKKDAEEISCIKKAAEIGARAFLEALDAVRPGMTEKEFESLLNYRISAAGGGAGFDMIVASGARGAMPHGRATAKPMERGECVTVDFGARWNGYMCDITRNFSIGAPGDEALALHALVKRAHEAGAAGLKAGASGGAMHEAAAAVFAAEGVEEFFTHSLGHSFGLEVHEAPVLSRRRDDRLEAGDVVTVEPGLYFKGSRGMRLEDDYLVTADGAERLTAGLAQELFVVSK